VTPHRITPGGRPGAGATSRRGVAAPAGVPVVRSTGTRRGLCGAHFRGDVPAAAPGVPATPRPAGRSERREVGTPRNTC